MSRPRDFDLFLTLDIVLHQSFLLISFINRADKVYI